MRAGTGLVRAVSRGQVVAIAVNAVVGSGVYLLPAAAAALLGAASVWAVPLAGLAVALVVLCFAEAGSYFDQPGAAYLYTREAFGDFVGLEVGWMSWLARLSATAALAAGLAQAVGFLWPGGLGGWGRAAVVVLPLLALTAINMAGVEAGARTVVALVLAKVLPLLLLVGAGIAVVHWPRVAGAGAPPAAGLGEAALILLFAYSGFEATAAPAGEYRDPKRDVPFALLVEITGVTLLYTVIQIVAVGTLPGLAESTSPLADAAGVVLGPWGAWALTIGAAVSILGTNGNMVLSGPRYLHALALDGYGPRALARVNPRTGTPNVAIGLQTALALPLALTGTFVGLAALSVVTRLVTYVGTAAAIPRLRRLFPAAAPAVRLPGGPLIPVAAVGVGGMLLASATPRDLLAGVLAALVGVAIFRTRRGRKAPASGSITRPDRRERS
ncbi:MAG: APC family permease [Gemmatimonadetes bacterium]|nr:APC family permease [Gemmatimonadota bacterium]